MRLQKFVAVSAAACLGLTLASCGDAEDTKKTDVSDVEEAGDLTGVPKELSDAGAIKIGVKMDQPGIGERKPGAEDPEGFDIDMGRYIAAKLNIDEDKIEWVETVSDKREAFLQDGTVDLVIASYSITDDRQQLVGQAGPYYVTGQQLLVREADKEDITGPDDLDGKEVCSVEGSTSLDRVEEEYGAKPVPFATYSECVDNLLNETVDAITTDGAILAGYAVEDPDNLEVVGDAFSEENYGVGYAKDAEGMCDFLKASIESSFEDGKWEEFFEANLGDSGLETPTAPTVAACP